MRVKYALLEAEVRTLHLLRAAEERRARRPNPAHHPSPRVSRNTDTTGNFFFLDQSAQKYNFFLKRESLRATDAIFRPMEENLSRCGWVSG